MARIGIQIISFNRPNYLKETLDSLQRVISKDDKICVIEQSDKDDMREQCLSICQQYDNIKVHPLFKNFGQRKATNLLYVEKFWDDCSYVMLSDHDNIFHDPLSIYVDMLENYKSCWFATGLNSPEHDIERKDDIYLFKSTFRAGHVVMSKEKFDKLMPMDPDFGTASWFAGLD